MSLTAAQLNALFPLPSPPPSTQAPGRLPGITHESSLELVKNLKENNRKWHIFFNDRGFHNHTSHHLLAMYQLGASGPLLDAAYKIHASYMRPAFASPEPVTTENFHLHLGDEKFYAAYLNFFSSELLEKGTATLENDF
ncbi:Oxidoreductase AflY [Grifola frondosa]|uniref:Oxidoreductase AflY n=1 Tax=Grifola frondosa TaxID=5627 RepID=A0A1C7M7P0_GRIFR|nr:Oxidoreductase AflY [Grifola frondosa]